MKKWFLLVSGMLIMLCLGTVYSWSVFRYYLEQELSLTTFESSLPYMFSLGTYALFMMLAGRYAKGLSPHRLIQIGGLLVGLGYVVSGFGTNLWQLILGYGLLTGAGVGIVYGMPLVVISEWFPKKSGLYIGLVLGGFGLSPFITAPLAQMLIREVGVFNSLKLLGLVFGILVPVLGWSFTLPHGTSGPQTSLSMKSLLSDQSFRRIFLNMFMGTSIGLTAIGMTKGVMVSSLGLTTAVATSYVSLFAAFNALGRPVVGGLADRLSIAKAMRLVYSLAMISSLLLLLSNSLSLFVIAFASLWFTLGGWLAIAPVATMKWLGRASYRSNYGVVFLAYGLGAIGGVGLIEFISHYFDSLQLVYGQFVFLSLLGIISSFKAGKSEKPYPV